MFVIFVIYMTILKTDHIGFIRKEQSFYDTCADWNKEDIFLLTQDMNAEKKNLNDD